MARDTPSTFLTSTRDFNTPSDLDGAIQAEKVMRFVGHFYVKDLTNDMVSEIKIIPPPKKGIAGFFSKAPVVKNKDINKILVEIKKGGTIISTGR